MVNSGIGMRRAVWEEELANDIDRPFILEGCIRVLISLTGMQIPFQKNVPTTLLQGQVAPCINKQVNRY